MYTHIKACDATTNVAEWQRLLRASKVQNKPAITTRECGGDAEEMRRISRLSPQIEVDVVRSTGARVFAHEISGDYHYQSLGRIIPDDDVL